MVERAEASAWRTSLPFEAKRFRTAGWYFSPANAYDLATAWLLDPRPEYIEAAFGNLDYAAGANPADVSYIPGLGRRWPHEVVSQYALNDDRILPPDGVPHGDVVPEFARLEGYEDELKRTSVPSAGDEADPYPFYDRWGDSFNTSAEVTVPILARCLGAAAFLMARSPAAVTPWRSAPARILDVPPRVGARSAVVARLDVPGMDLRPATIWWEAPGIEPREGPVLVLVDSRPGKAWIEAEARWVDGRRAFARVEYEVVPADASP